MQCLLIRHTELHQIIGRDRTLSNAPQPEAAADVFEQMKLMSADAFKLYSSVLRHSLHAIILH